MVTGTQELGEKVTCYEDLKVHLLLIFPNFRLRMVLKFGV